MKVNMRKVLETARLINVGRYVCFDFVFVVFGRLYDDVGEFEPVLFSFFFLRRIFHGQFKRAGLKSGKLRLKNYVIGNLYLEIG